MNRVSRRAFLRNAGRVSLGGVIGVMGGSLVGCGLLGDENGSASRLSDSNYNLLDPRQPERFANPLLLPGSDGMMGVLDLTSTSAEFVVSKSRREFLSGKPADVFTYEVSAGGRSYTNPLLVAKPGTAISVRLQNRLEEETIVHWHGLHVDWRNDGHPSHAIGQGGSYDYNFTIRNRGGTYWYHPHPHGISGRQAYFGLAGLLVVEDDEDEELRRRLDLELGVTDIPLVIQDRMLTEDGSLRYASTSDELFTGFVGDLISINGVINPVLDVQTRVYRFRVLNASTSRTYRLMFAGNSAQLPFHLIGTDGGLLDRPIRLQDAFISPGERLDLLVDLRSVSAGDAVFLKSGTFDPMHAEMTMPDMPRDMPSMPGHSMGPSTPQGAMSMAGASRLEDGEEFYLLKLSVKQRLDSPPAIPVQLSTLESISLGGAPGRALTLSASGSRWLINDASFEMDKELFRVPRGATEIWEIRNTEMSMPHPMHLHGFQAQVVGRRNSPEQVRRLALDGEGRLATDLGWKDTVLVWPGEVARLAVKLDHGFSGEQTYIFHCHNLEHEDGGMMVNYRVV